MRKTDSLRLNLLDPTDKISLDPINRNVECLERAVISMNRKNLLDNWCFADPIDQRGGYVVPPNVPYCAAGSSAVVGYTDKYYAVIRATAASAVIVVDDKEYVVAIADAIRGYAEGGYTIDGWQLSGVAVVSVNEGGTITVSAPTSAVAFVQYLENPLSEAEHTVSAIVTAVSGSVSFRVQNLDTWVSTDMAISEKGLAAGTFVPGNIRYRVGLLLGAGASVTLSAIKLELGSVQTLAHQDADGNLVMNDPPPDKGMELLKCIQSAADQADTYAKKVVLHTGNVTAGTTDITAGSTALATGSFYDVYE